MPEIPRLPLAALEGSCSKACINPDLLRYWNFLLQRRIAWIHYHRDNPGVNPGVNTTILIPGPDGLPICENLPPKPPDFMTIPYPDQNSDSIELKLLLEPANRAWARKYVATDDCVDRVVGILQDRSPATHFAWGRILDWIMNMDLDRDIKTLDLMEQIMDARRAYVRDSEQLAHFATKPQSILQ
ncbi:hypothetical protein FGADI_9076 [Fusarium gaditjirri]|uniref:Uncharacterized protein n=1 Tax=Fusarium gaditjirri TaxID=282569 RepID=A0A8H4WTB8_9HYPO|nr:hypothetical protein FGADI_9076 [Fusarium gaditjirri]